MDKLPDTPNTPTIPIIPDTLNPNTAAAPNAQMSIDGMFTPNNPDLAKPNTPDVPFIESKHDEKSPQEAAKEAEDKKKYRNPITGMGLNGDGVGGLKPKVPRNRSGNPVTGEGYKPGHTDMYDMANPRRLGTFGCRK